ncbi:hypothetical protein TNCV_4277481 [Trichonephila clavipes]|nr:hypothetical protein TNCV_4277481 [Trichonephila clavipes]
MITDDELGTLESRSSDEDVISVNTLSEIAHLANDTTSTLDSDCTSINLSTCWNFISTRARALDLRYNASQEIESMMSVAHTGIFQGGVQGLKTAFLESCCFLFCRFSGTKSSKNLIIE